MLVILITLYNVPSITCIVDSRYYLEGLLPYLSVTKLIFSSKVENIIRRIHCNFYLNVKVMAKKEKEKNKDTLLFSSSIIFTVSLGILCDFMHH